MRILELVVEPDREDHIARHGVRLDEIDQVVFGGYQAFRAKYGYYGLIGQTEAGRFITVFVGHRHGGVYGLITARDSDDRERELFRRYHKGD